MKWRRKYRICRLYVDDLWGNILRKGRRSYLMNKEEVNETVRFICWSKQRAWSQRENKEFYKQMRKVRMRLRNSRGSLRAKYKIKRYYGGMSQVEYKRILRKSRESGRKARIYKLSRRSKYVSMLLSLLEFRLSSIVYRLNLAGSIEEAGKFVRRGWITIDGEVVKNPKITVSVGSIVSVIRAKLKYFQRRLSIRLRRRDIIVNTPRYLEVDYNSISCIIIKIPDLGDIPYIGRVRVKDAMGSLT